MARSSRRSIPLQCLADNLDTEAWQVPASGVTTCTLYFSAHFRDQALFSMVEKTSFKTSKGALRRLDLNEEEDRRTTSLTEIPNHANYQQERYVARETTGTRV